MNVYRKIDTVFSYLVMIAVIAASATPLSALYYTQTALGFLGLAIIYFFIKNKTLHKLVVSKKTVYVYFAILFCIFCTWGFNRDSDINYYLGLIVLISASMITVEAIDFNRFQRIYVQIVKFISLYSIIFTILFNVNRGFLSYLPLVYQDNSNIASWRTFFYLYNVWDIYARFSIVRNSACFREPGVWGAFVSIAIIFKLIVIQSKKMDKQDIRDLVILGVGAAFSLSTATYFSLVLCFLIYYVSKKHSKNEYVVGFGVVLLGIAVVCFGYRDLLFDKFSSSNSSFVSVLDRISGVSGSIQSWINSPIVGSGYTKYFQYVTEGVNTFSFLFVLGEFGIFLFGIFLYLIIKVGKKMKFTPISFVIFLIDMVLILNTQNLIFTPIILSLLFYGTRRSNTYLNEY